MKKSLFVMLVSILGISFSSNAQHYDFWSVVSGDTLYFKITDPVNHEIEVTTKSLTSPYFSTEPQGAIVLPNTVTNNAISYTITSIGNKAFYFCDSLSSIVFPSTLVSIGDFAFIGCTGLTTIDIPSSVTTIGTFAFSGLTSLTDITSNPIIPPTIQDSTFHNIPLAIPLHIPCFSYSDYFTANIWSNFNNIVCFNLPSYSFASVVGGNTLYFNITDSVNNSVEIISPIPNGEWILNGSPKPQGVVVLPTTITNNNTIYTITSIGDNGFYNCSDLSSITFPSTLTSIGQNAFSNCNSLSSITLPNTLISIGKEAFAYCDTLETLNYNVIDSSNVGVDIFINCPALKTINIKKDVLTIPNFFTLSITDINVANNNTKYSSESGILLNKIKDTLILCPQSKQGAVTLASTITTIGEGSFYRCKKITSVIMPTSITTIEHFAFNLCSGLTTIELPNTITKIGAYAFAVCTSLNAVTLPNAITKIEAGTFSNCQALTTIDLPITIDTIGAMAFYGCINLSSITIPSSVISIGNYAFNNCKNLILVNFNAQNAQYVGTDQMYAFYDCIRLEKIMIGQNVQNIPSYAFAGINSLTHIYSEAIVPPTIFSNTFKDVVKTIPVYVPCGSIQAYQSNNNWSKFTNIQCLLGIDEPITTEQQTKLYPNPTNGIATLEIEAQTKAIDVFVYDVMGRNIKTYNLKANQKELNIDLTSFPKGIYQVKVENQTKKLIVK